MADPRRTYAGGASREPVRPHVAVAPVWRGAAGASLEVLARVTNRAPGPRVLVVAALGVDPAWLGEPLRTAVLAPGGSEVVTLTLQPPPGTLPASYPLVVSAQAVDPATGRPAAGETLTGIGETTLVVNPRARLTIDLEPPEVAAVSSRTITAVLRNSGGVPTSVTLSVTDPRHGRIRMRRSAVTVPAQGEVRVKGRARLSRPRLIGYGARHGYVVTATSKESVRHAQGVLEQRTLVGPIGLKLVAVLAILGVWLTAAVVLVPLLRDAVTEQQQDQQAEATIQQPDDGAGEDGGADGGEDGGDDGTGEDGGAGDDGAGSEAAVPLQLSGMMAGQAPAGVSVSLESKALVDEEAQGGVGVGVDQEQLDGAGLRNVAAFTAAPARVVPQRTVTTADDGAWAFPKVSSPGYYLLTFSKGGYQTQRYVVDSTSEAAKEPMEIELVPGDGSLSGRITGPGGAVPGAQVTISDGVNTLTTSSNSRGDVGTWSVTGLSTPGTYVVSATTFGMSSEAVVVDLGADGDQSVDLQLRRGVALLRGHVQERTPGGLDPIGGATVTVTDGEEDVRTVSSLTLAPRGDFYLPGLETPGRYTVTISAEGYQTQSHEVDLGRGEVPDELIATMGSSAGEISGRVLQRDGDDPAAGQDDGTCRTRPVADGKLPLASAGLTLSSPTASYKTVSNCSGEYVFEGITPGVYTLSAQYFGLVTRTITVRVDAGPGIRRTLVLRPIAGGVLPRTARLRGTAVDARDGQFIETCEGRVENLDACLTATVAEDPGGPPDFTTTFGADGAFTLPDDQTCAARREAGRSCGLSPGLHTVTVSAPGYFPTTIDVEVAEGRLQQLAPIDLSPVPTLAGQVRLADLVGPVAPADRERDVPATCVWLRSSGTSGTLPDCATAITAGTEPGAASDPGACLPGRAPLRRAETLAGGEGTGDGRTRWCAAIDADDRFSIEVPRVGSYVVTVVPTDPEYVFVDSPELVLESGTLTFNPELDRLGRVAVTVLVPSATDNDDPEDFRLVPAAGVSVNALPTTPTFRTRPTNAAGRTSVIGLPPGTYSLSGSQGSHTGSEDVEAVYNTTRSLTLRLTDPITGFVGKVLGSRYGEQVDVPGASVTLEAPTGFDDAGAPTSQPTVQMTTDAQGCFAIRVTEEPALQTGCNLGWTPESRAVGPDFVTDTMGRVDVISAPGWDELHLVKKQFDPSGRTDLALLPSLLPVDVPVTVEPALGGLDFPTDATVTVTALDEARSVTSSIELDPTRPGGYRLDWADATARAAEIDRPAAQAVPDNQLAVPGRYRITVTADGYAGEVRELFCELGAACTLDRPLRMDRLGTLELTLVSGDGTTPVRDAAVRALLDGDSIDGQTRISNASGRVTFTGVVASTSSEVVIEVNAPGHEHGTSREAGVVQLSCRTSPAADPTSSPAVVAGGTTTCQVTLRPLGSVRGTLRLLDALPGDPAPVVQVPPATDVTAQRCATVSGGVCTTVTGPRFTTRSSATTGGFVLTGTAEEEGLVTGTYVLQAAVENYRYGPGASTGEHAGVLASVTAGSATTQGIDLYVVPTDLTVNLDDGFVPVDGATVRLSRDAVASDGDLTATPVAGTPGAYRFDPVVPGDWFILWSGGGLAEGSQAVTLAYGSSGNVANASGSRVAASFEGVVVVGGTGTDAGSALGGAEVVLTCSDGRTGDLCPTSGPALSTLREPLVDTTDADGGYELEDVPPGGYTLTATRTGYLEGTAPVYTGTPPAPVALSPVLRTVDVSVTAHPDEPLSDHEATLTPLGSTPGDPITVSLGGTGSSQVSFGQVRWGCYDVTLSQPEDHLGTVAGPTGGQADAEVTCPDGITVPTEESSDPLVVGFQITAVEIDYTVSATPQPNHPAPGPGSTLVLTRPDGTVLAEVPGTAGAAGQLYLPPGRVVVTPRLQDVPEEWWPSEPVTLDLAGGESGQAAFDLAEITTTVRVTVPSLLVGETATIYVDPGSGQTALPPSVSTATIGPGGTAEFQLPYGSWLFEADWPGGPGSEGLEVTDPVDGHDVEIAPDPAGP